MKRLFLLLTILLIALETIFAVPRKYPANGIIFRQNFDNNLQASIGKMTINSLWSDSIFSFVPDADGKENGAILIVRDQKALNFNIDTDFGRFGKSTMVATIKLGDPHKRGQEYERNLNFTKGEYEDTAVELFYCNTRSFHLDQNLAITKEVPRAPGETNRKDVRIYDVGIQPEEWITVVATYDVDKQTSVYYAKGKKCTVENTYLSIPEKGHGSPNEIALGYVAAGNVAIDDFILYNRILSESEIQSLVGTPGIALEEATFTLAEGRVEMHWWWAWTQIIFALLCILLFNRPRRQWNLITAEDIRKASQTGTNSGRDIALAHLDKAFGYWKEFEKDRRHVEPGGPGSEPLQYTREDGRTDWYCFPLKKKYMRTSDKEFKEALRTGCTDEDVIEKMNLYVRLHNAAYRRSFNGKYWVFGLLLVCVFAEPIASDFGPIGNNYVGFPDGFLDKIIYIAKYFLPGVLISGFAYWATSFGLRYRVYRGDYLIPGDLTGKSKTELKAEMATKPAYAALASLGAIGAALAFGVYLIINAFAKASMETVKVTRGAKVVNTFSQVSGAGVAGVGSALAAFALAIFAIWFASKVIILLFNVLFIYKAIQNYVFKW